VAIYCCGCAADMMMCRADTPELSVDDMADRLTAAWNRRAPDARFAELEKENAERQWRPIETAPKDGTQFIAYSQDLTGTGLSPFVSLCAWHPDAEFCTCELREPTHWIQLPEPPRDTLREGKKDAPDGP
jgi:hypothetical protein